MQVELVRTTTRDGLRLDAAYTETRSVSKGPAAILLHGVAGNFYNSATFEPLLPRLQALGIATLAVNTRGHDSVFGASQGIVRRRFGAAYEIVDECRHDVSAWIDFCVQRGHQQVILTGHSLGAVKALYAQSHEKHAAVQAVIAISPPRLSYSAFMHAEGSSTFWESMHTAEELTKTGRGDDLFTSKYPFPLLITASAYIDKYGPAERYNVLKFTANVPCQTLFVYGSKELATGGTPFAGMPEAVMSLPNNNRRHTITIENADHFYTGVTQDLAEKVCTWLSRK